MRRAFVFVVLAACGGKIAPVDTFDDPPIVGTAPTPGTAKPLPTTTPPGTGKPLPLPTPKPTSTAKPPPDPSDPPPNDSFRWQAFSFQTEKDAYSKCVGGKKYVRPSQKYGVWVGVELCTPSMYKIYLGYSRKDVFYEVADNAGNGQDHCELVNPKFTIPNEDDITSACKTCDIDNSTYSAADSGRYVFERGFFGGPFRFELWSSNSYTAAWYECGVAIP